MNIIEERTKPEIIRGVADGDKYVMDFPDDTIDQLRGRYRAFFSRASEINRADGWQHYRIAIFTELRQIAIIANRKEAENGNQDES